MPARAQCRSLLAILAMAFAPPFAAPAAPVPVFLLAGQSNLAGRAPGDALPTAAVDAAVDFDYVCSFPAPAIAATAGAYEPHRSNGWSPLRAAPRHAGTPGPHFGPEIGFGRTLASRWPEQRLVLIKHGHGATSLAEDWNPASTAGRQLYREFLAHARSAFDRLDRERRPFELRAFVWCQGEADATRPDWADAYEGNLRCFLARVRKDLGKPALPVLIVLTGDGRLNPRMTHARPVREAQRRVAGQDAAAALVEADDLPLLDAVHYDAPAQLELGRRLAQAFLTRFPP